MPSLSPPVFPLDSVQRALGAKRGEEEVLGIFFEESQCSLAVIAGSLRVGWSHTLRSRQESVQVILKLLGETVLRGNSTRSGPCAQEAGKMLLFQCFFFPGHKEL